MWSGALNVLPQVYLLRHLPDQKGAWLSYLLLSSTVAAVAGVEWSRRQLVAGRELGRRDLVLSTVVWSAALVVMAGSPPSPWVFAAAFLVFRGVSNWLFNALDHSLVAAAGPSGAARHGSAATAAAMAGLMAAPVAIALLVDAPATMVAVLLAMGVSTVVLPWDAVPTPSDRAPAARSPTTPTAPH